LLKLNSAGECGHFLRRTAIMAISCAIVPFNAERKPAPDIHSPTARMTFSFVFLFYRARSEPPPAGVASTPLIRA